MSDHSEHTLGSRRVYRRQVLAGSGALVIGFSLAGVFRDGASRAATSSTATLAPGLPTTSVTPTLTPGLVATAANQTIQAVQTRNVPLDQVDSFLVVDKEGQVTIYSGKVELGTGVETALSQIVAQELKVPFSATHMIIGDTALTPDQGYTAGSQTLQSAGPVLEKAAAEARLVLLTRAAAKLGVPAMRLVTPGDGTVRVKGNPAKFVPYGDLVAQPFARKIATNAPTASPASYTIIGSPVPRVDIPPKLTGKPIYM